MLSWLRFSWRNGLIHSSLNGQSRSNRPRQRRFPEPIVELLEGRVLPSVSLNFMEFHDPGRIPAGLTPSRLGILPQVNGFPFPVGYVPDDLRAAYGVNNFMFGSVVGDGSGQTIAIVDAYDDPAFVNSTASNFAQSDLAQFDAQLGIADPPSFTKVNQSGQSSPLPGTDPLGAGNVLGNWEIEEALDIEWAHGMAPGAKIILVEATTDSNDNLFTAVATAAALPGVSAVSMSWGLNEISGENDLDSTFVTPSGHQGVTFLAASGDAGGFAVDDTGNPTSTPGILYPAASPNVVAVGGTTLELNDDDTVASETAWSGSGGGTSLFETEPTYQNGVQSTGFRTIPDVAFDADPNTGVAVYDSYNNTDNSGPWVQIGGTSLAAPAWAGLIAIANQGRVLAGASSLDGRAQTLPALYAIPMNDFTDITSGTNGVFNAGPGYDEVTGLGSPNAPSLLADLSTYGTANHMAVSSQPPSNVIAGDRFGIVVQAEDPQGGLDPGFTGTMTISLEPGHPGAVLGGTLTATATNGIAVFDGLTLNQPGTGFTIQITNSKFPTIATSTFNAITDPTPWQGTFYPVPTDASLRNDIALADSNGKAFNTIILSASTYFLSDKASGGIVIRNANASTVPSKTLTITGQGASQTIINTVFNWKDRIFEIEGSGGQSLNVTIQNLTIQGGDARDGGILGGADALGGGLLVDDANVTLTNDIVQNNRAQGAVGADGARGTLGAAGGAGGNGKNARGGGIYVASGTLSLFNDTFNGNSARGGMGGAGGEGGGQGTKSAPAVTGGQGGAGGQGGSAAGGGVYAAGGSVQLDHDTFQSNVALGGTGGAGGTGGSGGHGKLSPPTPGKTGGGGGNGGQGGAAFGGAIYLAGGSVTLTGTALQKNTAQGGVGGQGGHGGPGTAEISLTAILGGNGSTTLGGLGGFSAVGGPGGTGGAGGAGGAASAGGIYVGGGSLTLANSSLAVNKAVGGDGGVGGQGGTGGFGSAASVFGLPIGKTGGPGGTGGQAGTAQGGGMLVAGGKAVLYGATLNANIAQGGNGGAGGNGGFGPIAAAFGSSGIGTGSGGTGGGGSGGTGGGGGSIAISGGPGGNGGNGGNGKGGGFYVSGGALTLTNATVAGNGAVAGAAGTGGPGGPAGTGTVTGGFGSAGNPGTAFGGGLYVSGGALKLNNSTIALNTQTGSGSGGGAVVESTGSVTAVSTLFAANGSVDYSGSVTATDSLFQTAPTGTLSGSGNLLGTDPPLDTHGLQDNGGPTQTIGLLPNGPAIGKGTNAQNLFTDQRGFKLGSGPVDIGAYQSNAQADTQAPHATLQASAVTAANATALNPYTFTITYSDNVALSISTLQNAVIQVLPPGASAPITALFEGAVAVGSSDAVGNAPSFRVTYQIVPPGGAWTAADNGSYTIVLGGGLVADLAGNLVAQGSLGTFSVSVGPPTSAVGALAMRQTSDTFPVSVSFADPSGPGVGSVDLYVSIDNGPFTRYQTLSAGGAASGTLNFSVAGQDRNIYAFYSIAHDLNGAAENKHTIAASTYVPDLHPPVTSVLNTSSYANGIFTLNWSGTDPDQNTGTPKGSIVTLSIFVKVDGGAAQLVGQFPAGSPSGGVYSGSTTYAALGDGAAHTYGFYSIGVDDQALAEAAPGTADDTFSSIAFSGALTASLSVQKGLRERSFIQYLDVNFNQPGTTAALQSLASGLAGASANTFVELEYYGENLTSSSLPIRNVTLFGSGSTTTVTLSGSMLSINFGSKGITGTSTTAAGDGWYALGIDPTGNPLNHQVFWLTFYRLLGDVNGDGQVNGPVSLANTDQNIVNAARGTSGALLNADVNGDGTVNTTDLVEATLAIGHKVGATPPQNFPQFQLVAGATGQTVAPPITLAQVQALEPMAIADWVAAGVNQKGVHLLQQATIQVVDLGSDVLALEANGVILINSSAAGYSWYVSAGPGSNNAFGISKSGTDRIAGPGSPAAGKVDLLTVLEHELGHILGLTDNAQAGDLMDISLGLGERRSPSALDVKMLDWALRTPGAPSAPTLSGSLLADPGANNLTTPSLSQAAVESFFTQFKTATGLPISPLPYAILAADRSGTQPPGDDSALDEGPDKGL